MKERFFYFIYFCVAALMYLVTYRSLESFIVTSSYDFVTSVRPYGDAQYYSQSLYSSVCSKERTENCVVKINGKSSGYRISVPKQLLDSELHGFISYSKTFPARNLSGEVLITVSSTPASSHLVKIFLFTLLINLPLFFIHILFKSKTRRKKIEAELDVEKKERQLEQKLVSITRGVAHDIRSPLAAIDVVLKEENEELKGEGLELIKIASKRIHEIADNLLNSTKNEIRNLKKPSINSLDVAFDELINEKKIQFSKWNNIEIIFEKKINNPNINMDTIEFKRVVSNLINNSVEAIEEKTGKVEIKIFNTDEDLCLSIKDNGKGIPCELKSKVLKKDFSFGKKDGNGLGLSHAVDFINSIKGTLKIDSIPGVGTEVFISIPLL